MLGDSLEISPFQFFVAIRFGHALHASSATSSRQTWHNFLTAVRRGSAYCCWLLCRPDSKAQIRYKRLTHQLICALRKYA